MKNQKITVIPKVAYVDVTDRVATANFTTDFIEFPESKDWSIDVTIDNTTGGPADSFAITTAGSDLTDGSYPGLVMTGGAVVDITVLGGEVTVATLVSGGAGYVDSEVYSLVDDLAGGATPVQPTFTVTVTDVTDSTLSVLVCNTYDGVYKAYKSSMTDIALATTPNPFDSYMPFRYMKLAYTANNSTGSLSINISK